MKKIFKFLFVMLLSVVCAGATITLFRCALDDEAPITSSVNSSVESSETVESSSLAPAESSETVEPSSSAPAESSETVESSSSVPAESSETVESSDPFVWNTINAEKTGAAFTSNGTVNAGYGSVTYLETYANKENVYAITMTENANQFNGISIKAMYEKSYYQDILTVDPNAKVTFNLYWEDLMGVDQITVNKEVSYHRDNLKDTTANVWQKFEVSLSVLLTNWDKQGVGGDGNGASAALVGFSSSTATVTGNYVIYMADLTLETTASEEETLDPEESSKVVSSPAESSEEESSEEESSEETPPSIYKCENAWFNSYTPSAISEGKVYYVCNGVKSTSKGKIVYLDEFEGETGVYQVKTLSDYDQINGIVIEAIYDKSYYEEIVAVFPQATVNVDVWWDSDELDGATILQTNDKYDHGFSDYEGNEWVTLKISLATLIDNWDNMGNVSSTKGSFVSIGLNATDNYSFYVTNVRIEALTWNSFDYQKTSAPMAYGAVAYSATSSGIGDETSGATLEYLSDFSGREGVIKVKTNGTNLDGYNGLYITPKYDVSVYEQVLQKYPNATVNIDIGALSDEMKISTMLRYSLGLYDIGSSYSGYMDTFVTSHSDEVNWFTVSMDLADLVDHMNLGLPYSRGFYFLVIDQEDNEEELRDYCYYLSNIRINRGADYELPAYHEIDEDMVRNIQTFGSTEEGIAEVEYVTEYADVSNVLKISNTSNFTGSSGAYICPGLSLAEMATFYNQGVTVKMDVYLESMSGAITINDEAFIAIPGQWYTFEMSAYDIYKDYEENGRKRSGFIINVEHPEGEGSYCLYVGNIRWVVNGVEIVSNT